MPACSGAAAVAAWQRRSATRRQRSPPAWPIASWCMRALAQGQHERFGRGPKVESGQRRIRADLALRADVTGTALRDAGDALHARARRGRRCAARDRTGVVPPRAGQPTRGDAGPAARCRHLRQRRAGSSNRSGSTTAAWRTTAPPRWCWCRPNARAICRMQALLPARCAVAGSNYRCAASAHNAPDYGVGEFRAGGAAAVADGRCSVRRTSTCCRPMKTSPAA